MYVCAAVRFCSNHQTCVLLLLAAVAMRIIAYCLYLCEQRGDVREGDKRSPSARRVCQCLPVKPAICCCGIAWDGHKPHPDHILYAPQQQPEADRRARGERECESIPRKSAQRSGRRHVPAPTERRASRRTSRRLHDRRHPKKPTPRRSGLTDLRGVLLQKHGSCAVMIGWVRLSCEFPWRECFT